MEQGGRNPSCSQEPGELQQAPRLAGRTGSSSAQPHAPRTAVSKKQKDTREHPSKRMCISLTHLAMHSEILSTRNIGWPNMNKQWLHKLQILTIHFPKTHFPHICRADIRICFLVWHFQANKVQIMYPNIIYIVECHNPKPGKTNTRPVINENMR